MGGKLILEGMSSHRKGCKLSEETKKKISQNSSRYWLNKKFPEEMRNKISESNKGKKLSEETKKKISERMKIIRKGKKHSEETKLNMGMPGPLNPQWRGGISKDPIHRGLQLRISKAKQRALKNKAEGHFTPYEWELIKKQYGYKCPSCNKKEPQIKLTIDHIIPLSKGGSNWIENIQPLCNSCNSSKNVKIFKMGKNENYKLF